MQGGVPVVCSPIFPLNMKRYLIFFIAYKNHKCDEVHILTIPEPAMAEPTGKMKFSASWLSDIIYVVLSRNVG